MGRSELSQYGFSAEGNWRRVQIAATAPSADAVDCGLEDVIEFLNIKPDTSEILPAGVTVDMQAQTLLTTLSQSYRFLCEKPFTNDMIAMAARSLSGVDRFGLSEAIYRQHLMNPELGRKWLAVVSFVKDRTIKQGFAGQTPAELWAEHQPTFQGQGSDYVGQLLFEAFQEYSKWDTRVDEVLSWVEPVELRQEFMRRMEMAGRGWFLQHIGMAVHPPAEPFADVYYAKYYFTFRDAVDNVSL
ncbi:MAG: hypothetical protein ABIG95_04065 [Candidatus Woesearchaeota archaeon]